MQHAQPEPAVYVGDGLLNALPRLLSRHLPGKRCVLVTDNVLWPLYGRQITACLREAGYTMDTCVLEREQKVEPDEAACGDILMSFADKPDFFISVGSGVLTDLVRFIAARCGRPFCAVATAPSMDGYTSAIAPLLYHGVKAHINAVSPQLIVCDLEVLCQAPSHMIASGAGDVLGKYVAYADYMLGHIVNDEVFCHTCAQMCLSAADKVLTHAEAISARTPAGIRVLTESLLMTGLTISIIGSTRCVASMEHNMAHYWEMMKLYRGQAAPPHGASVGAATLLLAPLYHRFAFEDVSAIREDQAIAARLSREETLAFIHEAYGETAANALMKVNSQIFISESMQRARIQRVKEQIGQIRAVFQKMPDENRLRQTLQILGAPLACQDLDVDDDMRNLSLHCAADYRVRYTLIKTLRECGLLHKYLAAYPLPDGMVRDTAEP